MHVAWPERRSERRAVPFVPTNPRRAPVSPPSCYLLQIGPPPFIFGQFTPVAPQCTYTRPDAPDPATAAHMAAALALASFALTTLAVDDGLTPVEMREVAEQLYQYSTTNKPFDGSGDTFPPFNASSTYGVRTRSWLGTVNASRCVPG